MAGTVISSFVFQCCSNINFIFSLYHFFSLSQFPSSHFFLNICFFTAVPSCSAFLSACLPLISLAVVCSVSEPITPAAPPLWSAQTLMKQPCESATVGSEEFTCTTHTHTVILREKAVLSFSLSDSVVLCTPTTAGIRSSSTKLLPFL